MSVHFEVSKETSLILECLLKTKIGDVITFRELHNLTGLNDRIRLRNYFRTASRRAFRDHAMRFQSVRDVGYKRLDESEKNQEVSHRITRLGRHTRRVHTLHSAVAFNALDALGKLVHITNATQLSEIKKAASRKRRDLIAKTATKNKTVEAVIDGTLELFRKKHA